MNEEQMTYVNQGLGEHGNVLTYEELLTKCERLVYIVDDVNGDYQRKVEFAQLLGEDLQKKTTIITNVTEALQTAWENDEISDELVEDLRSWLELETTEETVVEIVARWHVTLTYPKGMKLGDISVEVDKPILDGVGVEQGYIQFIETEVNEL